MLRFLIGIICILLHRPKKITLVSLEFILFIYRTRAIISRGLYMFYPISKDHFFVFKEVFSENSVLMYGLYSRAASNQERLMMARVRYVYLRLVIIKYTPSITAVQNANEYCHFSSLSSGIISLYPLNSKEKSK